ncbi:hypothetical protein ILUMI_17540, partial [Ignelater luminosus]
GKLINNNKKPNMEVLIAEIPESVKLPFLLLSKLGLFSTNKFKAYIPMSILALIVANLVLIAMLQFLNVKRDISDIVRNLEDILAFSMTSDNIKKEFILGHVTLFFRFVKEFREAFSLVLLIEFVIDGPLICAELLAAFESRSYQNQMRHVIIFSFVTLQLAFFCIPANYITNEAMAVSDAVYFSNWYFQHVPSLKVPLLLIIQSSQNEITIKAGDLVIINAGTIVN